ncbi:imidazole glycerol phosphate synthase subunit HisH [Pontibacter sp. BAB1700]|nr:imidazole glycerol phosphate synthase subunit HisH [Pontibacter sp. BAB1700]
MDLVIVDYKAGNVQSVQFALERLGVQATLSCDFETIKAADKVIFPGVGEASSAMAQLRAAIWISCYRHLSSLFLEFVWVCSYSANILKKVILICSALSLCR